MVSNTGIVFTIFDTHKGPVPLLHFPSDLNQDIVNTISVKSLSATTFGYQTSQGDLESIISYPELNMIGYTYCNFIDLTNQGEKLPIAVTFFVDATQKQQIFKNALFISEQLKPLFKGSLNDEESTFRKLIGELFEKINSNIGLDEKKTDTTLVHQVDCPLCKQKRQIELPSLKTGVIKLTVSQNTDQKISCTHQFDVFIDMKSMEIKSYSAIKSEELDKRMANNLLKFKNL